ncbi:MAG: N-acetyltransferase [bacterium]|nr:N-acetyltransferase [bacterium]
MNSSISKSASIDKTVEIGEFCVIKGDVRIGRNCHIANHVVIYPGTLIGDDVIIYDHSIIGRPPIKGKRSVKRAAEDTEAPAEISSGVKIGSNAVIYNQTKIGKDVLIADSASVRERVIIGQDTIVGRLVTIENDTIVGSKCKLETGCYITAYSEIGSGCFIAPMVQTSNDNFLGRTEERFKHFKGLILKDGGRIGVGAVILPGIEIGEEAVVAAGSVVTKNIKAKSVVMGIPARYLRDVPAEEWFENQ